MPILTVRATRRQYSKLAARSMLMDFEKAKDCRHARISSRKNKSRALASTLYNAMIAPRRRGDVARVKVSQCRRINVDQWVPLCAPRLLYMYAYIRARELHAARQSELFHAPVYKCQFGLWPRRRLVIKTNSRRCVAIWCYEKIFSCGLLWWSRRVEWLMFVLV